ncbi:MAG: redoxin family protein [Deltaproteobacteria bacterium]|nr:redoxin family protein [Deltaproteobacteria bacterium]
MRLVTVLLSLAFFTACTPSVTLPDPGVVIQPGAVATVGALAPDFSLGATDGQVHKLSEARGQVVVLEWFNPDCPFIQEAHGKGALETRPASLAAEGVRWIPINSNTTGATGSDPGQNAAAASRYDLPGPVWMDPTGAVGRAYGASTTPHLFVIDAQGVLIYVGAPDNAPLGQLSGGEARVDYLGDALRAAKEGTPPTTPRTKAWGCTVKYGA